MSLFADIYDPRYMNNTYSAAYHLAERDSLTAANQTTPVALVCPNFYLPVLGVCVQYYSILPMGWQFFRFFDWQLICVAIPAILAYLSIMAHYINSYRESKSSHYRSMLPFHIAYLGVAMHFLGALSRFALYYLTGDASANAFVFLWAISFVLYWVVTIGIVAFYFNFYILKWSDVQLKSGTSPYVYLSCGLTTAAAVLYGVYIITVTIKFKSKVPHWVNVGWYIMMAGYIVVGLNALVMLPVVSFLREKANLIQKKSITTSARVVVWWTWMTLGLQLFALATIIWFLFYKGEIATNLPTDALTLLRNQGAGMQSMMIRYNLNIINSVQSIINIYFLCFGMKNIVPFADLVWFFNARMRKDAYRVSTRSTKSTSRSKHGKLDSSTDTQMSHV